MTDLLDHARLYLALGFAVLPLHFPFNRGGRRRCSCAREECGQPGKHPLGRLVKNGLKDASRDLETVERWFTNTRYNIGIVTGAVSRIVALDIDPRHDGDETLRALEAEHGELPETWRFLTGGGGEHILFLHPGRPIANSAGLLGSGIDARGDDGYLVGPPSEHVSGRPYAISVDHHPQDLALAQLPKWLFDRLVVDRKEEKARKAAEWRTIAREGAKNGERNVTIARLSGLLLGRRIDPHVCLELILAFNATRCRPPLPEDEVVATVASIARREYAGRSEKHDHG
jgi:putative DNA primase/helicase